jgi:hypothetical protein
MASYTTPNEPLDSARMIQLMSEALPGHAFRHLHEWTWTRTDGVWKANLTFGEDQSLVVRMERRTANTSKPPSVTVPLTRRGINAALRWLVLLDAIDRHPDDPIAVESA